MFFFNVPLLWDYADIHEEACIFYTKDCVSLYFIINNKTSNKTMLVKCTHPE